MIRRLRPRREISDDWLICILHVIFPWKRCGENLITNTPHNLIELASKPVSAGDLKGDLL